MRLTETQLSHWRQLKSQFDANPEWQADFAKVRAKREVVRPQIAQHLNAFLGGEVTLEEFRSIWDSKTRSIWKSFGLAGLSSAMFLNILVKHLPDPIQTTEELKRVALIPEGEENGRSRLQAFEVFLEGQIKAGNATRKSIQTARIPFFVSAFWHMQNPETWPMFFVSARNVFEKYGLYSPKNSVVEDYFAFRDVYLPLMSALKVSSWDLEHICWYDYEDEKPIDAIEPDVTDDEREKSDGEKTDDSPSHHAQAQWLLASIGKSFKLKIWVASNDHSRQWNGHRLGDISVPELPPLGSLGDDAEKIVRRIDVLWLRSSGQIVAAFEIEHSTSIYSGLLRMADLTVLCANISFPLYIVAPECRMDQVARQLSRPSLQRLGLHNACGFFSIENLIQNADHIMKWGNNPDAIKKLAKKVKPLDDDEPH
jgi:hypothetical protein